MGAVVNRVTLDATGKYLLARAGEGYGQGGWQVALVGSGWTGSGVLKNPTSAPGSTLALGSAITYYTTTSGASATAALTTDANVIVQNVGSDLYFDYTHTAGSVTITVMAAGELIGSEEGLLPVLNPVFAGTLSGPTIAASGAVSGTTGTFTDDVSVAKSISSLTPATERLVRSEVTLTGATIAITSSGSIAGVRGGVTVPTSKTLTEGFLYGAQGKVTLTGTINEGAAARIAGVLGQVDLSTGTVTAGQISALWGDFQGTPTMTTPAQVNIIRATNSSNATVNAVLMAYGKASYFATMSADGGAANVAYWGAAAPGTLAKSIKVLGPDGVAYYIGLYSSPT